LQGPTSGLGDGDGDGDFFERFNGCWLSAMSTCSSIMLLGQSDSTVLAVLEVGLGLVLVLLVATVDKYLGDEAGELAIGR
jgi:membrane protein YqaA with SNARE-associated domain